MKSKRHILNLSKPVLTILLLLIAILIFIVFRQQPVWVERYYYVGFYSPFCHIWRPVFNCLPFSIGDVLYAALIIAFLTGFIAVIKHIIKKRFKQVRKLLIRFLVILEIAWLVFYLFWGLNYYRPPAAALLQLQDTAYTQQEVVRITNLIIDSANICRKRLNLQKPLINDDIFKRSLVAVNQLKDISAKLQPVNPGIKASLFSGLFNYLGTSGYYNPLTAEAQINKQIPVFDRPFVACHEMAHQTGFAREDEANFAGYLACVTSKDDLLKYSAYYAGMLEFMHYLRHRDSTAHHSLRLRISPLVMQDVKTDSAYWAKYDGAAQVLSGKFFDRFLKANNQPHGLKTYNRMIRLTMAWYRKRYHVW